MSLFATYIAIFASTIASVPGAEANQYSCFSSDMDSIYVSRRENATEHMSFAMACIRMVSE